MIARLREEWDALPSLVHLGFGILVIGGILDIVYHTAPPQWAGVMNTYLGQEGSFAHLITFVGMVLALAGVIARSRLAGLRRRTRMPAAPESSPASSERR